ncbi:MAG: ATP-binding cassette domain-containing protein [Acidobacteria bacterium]|nr:ATP-binding cassette domain-containing protein [Acidobacteriota bacterium]
MSEPNTVHTAGKRLRRLATDTFATVAGELVLDDVDCLWWVESGEVDVFVVELEGDRVVSSYKHVTRAEAGRLLFCVDGTGESRLQLRLKGLPGFRVQRLPLPGVLESLSPSAFAQETDLWVEALSECVARDVPLLPRVDIAVRTGEEVLIAPQAAVSAHRGIVWLPTRRVGAFLGTGHTGPDMPEFMPVTPCTWMTFGATAEVSTISSLDLVRQGRLEGALREFHRMVLAAERLTRRLASIDVANLQVDSAKLREGAADEARRELRRIAQPGRGLSGPPLGGSPLMQALRPIGRREQIRFVEPEGVEPTLEGILIASGVRAREVDLSSESNWWNGDSFSMLAFRREDGRPVALLPSAIGPYRIIDPSAGGSKRLNGADVARLEDGAWVFYRPFPPRPVTTKDVAFMAGHRLPMEAARFAAAGLLVGLCAFFPPFAVGLFADWVMPAGSRELLWSLTAVMLVVALFGVLMTLQQTSTLLRVEARAATRLGAAVWDRIVALRPSSLRGYSAGELTSRALVFHSLRERASNVVTSALVSVLFLFPTLFFLFSYDPALAGVSLTVGLAAAAAIVGLAVMQFAPQRRHVDARQRLAGTLSQLIAGIGKLRSSGAEDSAFAFWARGYVRQKRAEIQVNRLNELAVAITASIPGAASAILLATTLLLDSGDMTAGAFFVIYATSMMFFGATTRLGATVQALSSIIPEYQQVKPLLALAPDVRDDVAGGGEVDLRGDLRFERVGFAHPDSDAAALDDVSLHIRPGEFAAIVGESGAGKSTLLNLALGLEEPTRGAVYYDDHDVAQLNRRTLRRQLGVVSQNGSLQPGSVLTNIIGVARDLTEENAWEAARLAAVDEDIRQMHMGMHTPVGDTGAFSGGQMQRILIAAALVRKPRVVFLDEATNWLDNKSQALVMESIGRLAATRVVIAHRLSTIRAADTIHVLEKGRLVQSGSYEDLAREPGAFQRLIARQLLEPGTMTEGEQA